MLNVLRLALDGSVKHSNALRDGRHFFFVLYFIYIYFLCNFKLLFIFASDNIIIVLYWSRKDATSI